MVFSFPSCSVLKREPPGQWAASSTRGASWTEREEAYVDVALLLANFLLNESLSHSGFYTQKAYR